MVLLSEIPGDPNGDDPNNNPQEEEEDNQNKNPQEEEEVENPQEEEEVENPQEEVENLPILLELPTDLIQRIIAHIPRCYSPSPTLVCRALRQVITSDELYVTRSLLGFTKPILYALIRCTPYTHPIWFFLCWSNIGLHLRRIRSLLPMFPGAAVVTIEYKMYTSSSCVVGDLLYALDLTCTLGYPIVVYNPNELVWGPVLGGYSSYLPILSNYRSKMANFGGKLMIFCSYRGWFHDIWCIVIALETRQENQIWGVFESISLVFRDVMTMPSIELCRTVMV
ncbi:unnamed protein product [Arabidopsis arenosa]|uniref:F-box domain-containing protein n=1 Tax=Arabidopsis arenosa TaxID=38785 RepID=A0A8S2A7S9_ARAAE|nr:unnamed protein product [Arabidopsis arenosa]